MIPVLPSPGTVLVAEDQEETRGLLATLLKGAGYRVVLAEDGQEALDLLATGPVDIALLDVMMPRHTGFEVCRRLKCNLETKLLPVVLITGLSSKEDRIEGIECGADDFLSKPFSKEELIARVKSLVRIKQYTDELERSETVLFSLALSIEAKDPYTEGHCDRLSKYAAALGQRIGLQEPQIVALHRGGIVHDLGKIGVSENILQKPGPLTAEEWVQMKKHPEIGERICRPLRSFGLVLPIIRWHHEKMDGSGYPDGLKKDEIPVNARILTTVDVYDALTTKRPYRDALRPEEAFGIMRSEAERGWWDRDLVAEFEALMGDLPRR